MARIRTPVCRLCRREGVKLMLKGERCLTPKCPIERRNYPPGQHGQGFRRRQMSDYGGQLREKQKLRRIFFVMEKQFRRHFDSAQRMKGITGTNLLQVLERRLDNVVFRLGFADSRRQARQLVNHGHFVVNGRKTNIPSFIVKVGDEISVRPQSRTRTYFTDLDASGILRKKAVPEWLSLDAGALAGRVLRVPERSEMDLAVNEQLVVELYSR
ncbi:MAG TPA: 30S ribosomal protein S4 [Herpetosiphonaceae bacterium]|nr:30S ribosomal protein S4 [Herpetosiphonaceae bacterium]